MMAVQFHTDGLRQPMLIGKDPAGKKLPGGPYVVWQAAGLLIAPLMWNTAHWWGPTLGPLGRVILIIAATLTACWALGRLDFAGRNPLWALAGIIGALRHSVTGTARLRGRRRPDTLSGPHRGHVAPTIVIGTLASTSGDTERKAAPVPTQATVVVSDLALTSGTTTGPTPLAEPGRDHPSNPSNLNSGSPSPGAPSPGGPNPGGPNPGDPALVPAQRLSPLETFIAAAGSTRASHITGRSNP